MRLPIVKNNNRYERKLMTFGGLNLLQSFREGEMSDCSGISHRLFPAITQREKSENVFSCINPSAIAAAPKECIAASGALYYDREKVMDLTKGEKTISFSGNKVIVFPDKVYYDTQSGESGNLSGECSLFSVSVKFGQNFIEAPKENFVCTTVIEQCEFVPDEKISIYESVSTENNKVELSGLSLKGIDEVEEGNIFWEKCEQNQYRIAISVQKSENGGRLVITNELVTLKNAMKDIFAPLRTGDVVEVSGCTLYPQNNKRVKIISKEENKLFFLEGAFSTGEEKGEITIKREIPDFTCVCSYNNRLWGCAGNTIYASALGDPFNFFKYNNLSTDSFTVQSNTAGDFTACTVYGNYCLFFKENECYKLYGDRPANFTLSECVVPGIKKSDFRSIANVGGQLFYKGNGGIFAFRGGLAQCVSEKLGNFSMENAVAGSDGKRYFVTGDTQKGREEFVYDDEKALWSKSGETDTKNYAFYSGKMHRLKTDGVYRVSDSTDEQALWYAVLCPFDEKYYGAKNYSRIRIKAQLSEGAYLSIDVKNGNAPWENIATVYGNEKKYVDIPCTLKNCREVTIRLGGKGKSIVESVLREFCIG